MRRNYRKHTDPNPLHRWLLNRFHAGVADLVERTGGAGGPGILDVGCGEGFVLDYLRRRGFGGRLVGMDADRSALTMARRAEGDLLLGSASTLPFGDSAFPLVLCLEVLEHLDRPEPALAELARVSAAHVIASVPSQPFFAAANLLRGKNLWSLGEDPEHRHHWTAGQFLRLVSGTLHIERVLYPFPWVVVLGHK